MEGGLEGFGGGWEPKEVAEVGTQVGEGRSRPWKGERKGVCGKDP